MSAALSHWVDGAQLIIILSPVSIALSLVGVVEDIDTLGRGAKSIISSFSVDTVSTIPLMLPKAENMSPGSDNNA